MPLPAVRNDVANTRPLAVAKKPMTGTVYGVGLGPGDPDLMSVRADRLLRDARHVAYFRKSGRSGQARAIAEGLLHQDVIEIPMEYPVTTEIPLDDPRYNACLSDFYAGCQMQLRQVVETGQDVVVLCEGDPFFYGSFMHLYSRLQGVCPLQVVPGIMGMTAAWHATGVPVTWGDDVMTVLMGTLPEPDLIAHMTRSDAIAVMKIGRHFDKVCKALRVAGRFDDAWLVEYASMQGQQVRRLSSVTETAVPYFSILIIHGQGRRP